MNPVPYSIRRNLSDPGPLLNQNLTTFMREGRWRESRLWWSRCADKSKATKAMWTLLTYSSRSIEIKLNFVNLKVLSNILSYTSMTLHNYPKLIFSSVASSLLKPIQNGQTINFIKFTTITSKHASCLPVFHEEPILIKESYVRHAHLKDW